MCWLARMLYLSFVVLIFGFFFVSSDVVVVSVPAAIIVCFHFN